MSGMQENVSKENLGRMEILVFVSFEKAEGNERQSLIEQAPDEGESKQKEQLLQQMHHQVA